MRRAEQRGEVSSSCVHPTVTFTVSEKVPKYQVSKTETGSAGYVAGVLWCQLAGKLVGVGQLAG